MSAGIALLTSWWRWDRVFEAKMAGLFRFWVDSR